MHEGGDGTGLLPVRTGGGGPPTGGGGPSGGGGSTGAGPSGGPGRSLGGWKKSHFCGTSATPPSSSSSSSSSSAALRRGRIDPDPLATGGGVAVGRRGLRAVALPCVDHAYRETDARPINVRTLHSLLRFEGRHGGGLAAVARHSGSAVTADIDSVDDWVGG